MLVYFIKEVLICILLSSLIIGAGHYAVYIFEHNKNINYPMKPYLLESNNLTEDEQTNSETTPTDSTKSLSDTKKEETNDKIQSNNKEKLKESLERLKKLT